MRKYFYGTICNIDLARFADGPTPEELGAIIARWDSEDQAAFLIAFGEQLKMCCPVGLMGVQTANIRDALAAQEERLQTGYGSDLIKELQPSDVLDNLGGESP